MSYMQQVANQISQLHMPLVILALIGVITLGIALIINIVKE